MNLKATNLIESMTRCLLYLFLLFAISFISLQIFFKNDSWQFLFICCAIRSLYKSSFDRFHE